MVGLVPMPGLRVDGRDHPVRGHLAGNAQHPVRAGLQVLPQHRGQQPHGLRHRVGQLLAVQGGQHRVPVPGAGVDQRVPGCLVVPVDDRLAGTGVVVTAGQQGPKPPGQVHVDHAQQATHRRADQRDRVHRGHRVVQRGGVQHPTPAHQSRLLRRVQRHSEDPIRVIRATQPLPHVDQHGVREPDPVRRTVPTTDPGRVAPPYVEGEPLHRLPVRQAFQALQHHHRGHHRRRHRPAAIAREQVREQPIREQCLPLRVQERVDRRRRQHRVTQLGHRIQQVQLLTSNTQRHAPKPTPTSPPIDADTPTRSGRFTPTT